MKLISENRIASYLKYAFGEIILVVVGILIAVQINSWNNNRIQENTNILLLHKLINELQLNINRMEVLDNGAGEESGYIGIAQYIVSSDSLNKILQEGIAKDNLEYLVETPNFVANSYSFHSAIFEEMKNTGKLYSIGSKTLIDEIQKYYQRLEREESYNQRGNEWVDDSYKDLKYGWDNFLYDYKVNKEESIGMNQWLFNNSSKEYIDLKIFMAEANQTLKFNQGRMHQIIEESEHLIDSVNNELGIE